MSDGSEATFSEVSSKEFQTKAGENSLEGKIYEALLKELSASENQREIKEQFPKKSIHRRNTGYAVDALLDAKLFGGKEPKVNLAKLLCGSEGTLAFSIALTLQLDPLPPQEAIMLASHFSSIKESLKATTLAMKHHLYTCELMDKVILDCTKNNREQAKNRFFLNGDPEAILMFEVKANSREDAETQAQQLIADLEAQNLGYHHTKLYNDDIKKALDLRKAGLGLLGNMIGDKKAVACIEDTAVALEDLPEYIEDFSEIMEKYQQKAVYYAHAGAGETPFAPHIEPQKKRRR